MFENNNDYGRHADLSQRFQSGANWLYWIAALTLITSIIGLMGGGWSFYLSLGITQLIDGLAIYAAERFGEAPKVIAVVMDISITAMFAALAFLANKRHMWAFMTGMVVFFLDSLLSLLILDWISLIFHGFALAMMIRGYLAGRELVALERAMSAAAPPAQAAASPATEPAPASSF